MRRVFEVVDRERVWKVLSTVTGLVGGLIARKALRATYEAVRKDPEAPSPFDPANAQFSWANVLVWAAAAGLGLGIAKVVSARIATLGWEVATGSLPPGVSPNVDVSVPSTSPT